MLKLVSQNLLILLNLPLKIIFEKVEVDVLPLNLYRPYRTKKMEIELIKYSLFDYQLHRRLSEDDGRGVSEALNEVQYDQGLVARGKHLVYLAPLIGTPTPVAKQRRWSRDNLILYPWAFYTSTDLSESEWRENYTISVIHVPNL